MQPETDKFRTRAAHATQDAALQKSLRTLADGFVAARATAVADIDFEDLRTKGQAIRQKTLANLADHLTQFEKSALAAGSQVHWAASGDDACAMIAGICADIKARSVVKGKSMVSEEIALNAALEHHGFEVTETDLGEYLLQIRGDVPSHIVAPAIHLSKEDARDTFTAAHDTLDPDRALETAEDIVAEARAILREKFLKADVGITGANFLIAETGSAVVVTNEGNGDLTATLPRVHIIVAGIEKVVPTLADTDVLLRLLARSATGQKMTAYTSLFTGPKRRNDEDGPDTCHVVLVDNGRSELLGSPAHAVLGCIRCGACLNHCPIYAHIGGHAYGWVYPGPIGAILNPGLLGAGAARDLPRASSLCGRCEAVCPVKIPIPKILRHWRAVDFQTSRPRRFKIALSLWGWLARRPGLYRVWARIAARALTTARGHHGSLPIARGWTAYRDMPSAQRRTFQDQWVKRSALTKSEGA